VPSTISREGTTVLSPAYHWLRASVAARAAAIAATQQVSTQGAEVIAHTSAAHDASRLETALLAGTIAKPLTPVTGLKAATNPFPTFGGRAPEAAATYHRRVSELLRHKGRASTLHDFEALVLEYFPRVYRVKCLTHTRGVRGDAGRDLELAPGHVTLVVVPDLSLVNAVNPFEPRLPAAELEEIRQFLVDKASPGAVIRVLNPNYEPIRIAGRVRLRAGRSTAFYEQELQRDLRGLLAPWTRGGGDITFGGRFYYSTAVHFLEQLPYVDYVEDLRILNVPDDTFQQATRARSVLTTVSGPADVPANLHAITIIEA
ncbi:MAG: baseplate J/gp47 family protein, partial [Bacteroidota bacterium]